MQNLKTLLNEFANLDSQRAEQWNNGRYYQSIVLEEKEYIVHEKIDTFEKILKNRKK